MLALALLASHLVGDFVFQTRWQANGKLHDGWLRARHVWAYTAAFAWVAFLDVPLWRILVFAGALAGLHFLTDSRRFRSTLGDVLVWWGHHLDQPLRRPRVWMPPPNPWPTLPLMIDQTAPHGAARCVRVAPDVRDGCAFCDYGGPSEILRDYGDVFVIEPLHPVTDGHRLVIPRLHVPDFDTDTRVSVAVLACAVRYAREHALESYNIITSKGAPATQTVEHLHVHVVPRRDGDGLALPWAP